MKKNIKYVCVLITLTLFMFVSCSGNLTDTLLKVMDSTNTNVFEQAGIVKPDTSAADNALKAMNSSKVEITAEADGSVNITDQDEFKAIKEAGIEFKLTGDLATAAANGVLAPQTAEQKASFAAAINSTNEASQKALEEKLTKPVSDKDKLLVQGTMAVASGAITAAKDSLPDGSVKDLLKDLADQLEKTAIDKNAEITEADKVQAQLLTNIAVSASKAKLSDPNDPKTKELINDTLTLYTTAKIASGSVDILQTEGLFDLFTNQKASSKEVKKEEDFSVKINADQKYVDLVINLIKNGLGTDSSKYNSKYNSYKCMVDARNLTFAIVTKAVDDSTIKASATTGSVIELINAALFANLLDPSFTLPVSENSVERGTGVSFRTILMNIVASSPDLFTKGEIKSDKYSKSLNSLFGSNPTDSNTDFNKIGIQLLENLLPTAETADNMMGVGGIDIKELLKTLNISGETGEIKSIKEWIDDLIKQMKGNPNQEVTE